VIGSSSNTRSRNLLGQADQLGVLRDGREGLPQGRLETAVWVAENGRNAVTSPLGRSCRSRRRAPFFIVAKLPIKPPRRGGEACSAGGTTFAARTSSKGFAVRLKGGPRSIITWCDVPSLPARLCEDRRRACSNMAATSLSISYPPRDRNSRTASSRSRAACLSVFLSVMRGEPNKKDWLRKFPPDNLRSEKRTIDRFSVDFPQRPGRRCHRSK